MKYARRKWWYPASWSYKWFTCVGCKNFEVHPTWRLNA